MNFSLFLSQIGGSLGLCLAMSFLSIIEIFYQTIRIVFHQKTNFSKEINLEIEGSGRKLNFKFASFAKYCKKYCLHSSLHGISHVVNRISKPFEKIFWAFSLLLSIFFLCIMVRSSYQKLQLNPIAIGYNDTIWNIQDVSLYKDEINFTFFFSRKIPFPAVTFCTDYNVAPILEKSGVRGLMENNERMSNLSDEE